MFREKVGLLRLRSSIKVFHRAKEILNDAGFSEPKPVDLKTLIPLLEHCSLENEESDLIDKWAGLLATASSSGLKTYSYPHILNQISPNEAKIIDFIYDKSIEFIARSAGVVTAKMALYFDHLSDLLNIDQSEITLYLLNLNRLGLAEVYIKDKILNISAMGLDFVTACRGPKQLLYIGEIMKTK